MQELTTKELEARLAVSATPFALFVYTPMCGTCKVAERMLTIVQEALPQAPLFRVNINSSPALAERWQITSVPALLLIDQSGVFERHYALKSVGFVYERLKTLV